MSARRLALLIGLAAIGWALALLRPGAEPVTPDANAAKSAPPAAAKPAASPQPKAITALEPGAQGEPAPARAPGQAPDETVAAEDAERLALRERLADEGHHRHDQRFDSAVERWQEEQSKKRQEPWASRREQALRRAMSQDRMEQLAERVECRATLCRIQLTADDDRTALRVRRAHHFMREVGFQTAGAFAGEGKKRVMVLYVAREGTQL